MACTCHLGGGPPRNFSWTLTMRLGTSGALALSTASRNLLTTSASTALFFTAQICLHPLLSLLAAVWASCLRCHVRCSLCEHLQSSITAGTPLICRFSRATVTNLGTAALSCRLTNVSRALGISPSTSFLWVWTCAQHVNRWARDADAASHDFPHIFSPGVILINEKH